jgi:GNAT superfamily N-acetyltransferase
MQFTVRQGMHRDTEELVNSAMLMMEETENIQMDAAVVRAGVEKVLADQSLGFYAVAETDQGEFAGSLFVNAAWMDLRCGYYWWIHCVHVRSHFRRQNVYEKLYEFVKEHGSVCGNVIAIRLCVHDENVPAKSAYEKRGMQKLPYVVYQERL